MDVTDRFLVFAYETYYPHGGADDLLGSVSNVGAAWPLLPTGPAKDGPHGEVYWQPEWAHVYDVDLQQVAIRWHRDCYADRATEWRLCDEEGDYLTLAGTTYKGHTMGLSIPDQWTPAEVQTRFDIRAQMEAQDKYTPEEIDDEEFVWSRLLDVAMLFVGGPDADSEQNQHAVQSLYEAALHRTAADVPEAPEGNHSH